MTSLDDIHNRIHVGFERLVHHGLVGDGPVFEVDRVLGVWHTCLRRQVLVDALRHKWSKGCHKERIAREGVGKDSLRLTTTTNTLARESHIPSRKLLGKRHEWSSRTDHVVVVHGR